MCVCVPTLLAFVLVFQLLQLLLFLVVLMFSPPLFHVELEILATNSQLFNITSFISQEFFYNFFFNSLPWFAGAVAAGRRRRGPAGRTAWGVWLGAEEWGAPCPNQGASPALPPWGPWGKTACWTRAPPRNLGIKTEQNGVVLCQNGGFTLHANIKLNAYCYLRNQQGKHIKMLPTLHCKNVHSSKF